MQQVDNHAAMFNIAADLQLLQDPNLKANLWPEEPSTPTSFAPTIGDGTVSDDVGERLRDMFQSLRSMDAEEHEAPITYQAEKLGVSPRTMFLRVESPTDGIVPSILHIEDNAAESLAWGPMKTEVAKIVVPPVALAPAAVAPATVAKTPISQTPTTNGSSKTAATTTTTTPAQLPNIKGDTAKAAPQTQAPPASMPKTQTPQTSTAPPQPPQAVAAAPAASNPTVLQAPQGTMLGQLPNGQIVMIPTAGQSTQYVSYTMPNGQQVAVQQPQQRTVTYAQPTATYAQPQQTYYMMQSNGQPNTQQVYVVPQAAQQQQTQQYVYMTMPSPQLQTAAYTVPSNQATQYVAIATPQQQFYYSSPGVQYYTR
jgi:hypothetical protein